MPMRSLVLFLVFFPALSLFAVDEPIAVAPRIIDGINVSASQFPTVGIVSDSPGTFICTGTLIAPRFVLTAAHCAVSGSTGKVNIGQTGGRFMLGGVTYSTVHVYAHPSYKGDSSQEVEGAIDLCVFELSAAVPGVTPSPLYRQVPQVGTKLTLVGYGEQGTGKGGTNGTLPASGTVNYGYTPIDIVTGTFIKWNFNDVPAPNKESNTAPGDSGGPQFITVNSVLQVASVTSGGSSATSRFGDLSYNTRVDIAAAWIDSITGGQSTGGNTPPTVQSISYLPNPAVAAQPVTFTVAASDAEGDPLSYHWFFGDGSEVAAGSANQTHAYLADGMYSVVLYVTDGKGGSTEADIAVKVGNGQVVNVIPSTVFKKHFMLNFSSPARSTMDFTLFNFDFMFSDKFSYLNAFDQSQVNVYIGSTKIDTLSISGTRAKGVNGGALTFSYRMGNVRYQVRGNANLVPTLAPFGASNNTSRSSFYVPLRLEFNGTMYGGDALVNYTSREGKTGTGK